MKTHNKETVTSKPPVLRGILSGEGAGQLLIDQTAARLDLPVIDSGEETEADALYLLIDPEGMALQYNGRILRGDFRGMARRLRSGNLQREMLVKAVRIKGLADPVVIDATAGMGEDAVLLAAAGCQVQLYERDPVIAALLSDALRRASLIPELCDTVSRMHLHEEDSVPAMKSLIEPPDVILLDPMFPERQKSAMVKKKFQLLHHLERPCEDEEQLLKAAIEAHPRKIVIKRPLKGTFLAGRKPDYSLKGKAIRYDCLVFAR